MQSVKPTKEQLKACKGLERAFTKCAKTGVYFHNCYGKLIAYNGDVVKEVNDTETDTSCREGYILKIKERLDSWADDLHYVHKKEQK